jgi:hypothetical protein
MAHQRYIGNARVLHTRKLSPAIVEVLLQNPTPGGPRQRTVLTLEEYEKKVRQIPVVVTETPECLIDHRKPSRPCLA